MAFKKILRASYGYQATADDELTFNENDILGIIENEEEVEVDNDGWYFGCNVINDPETKGFIPKTYCEEVKVLSLL